MAVINYIRLGSELIGERPLGGVRTNYARDALGSVRGTMVGSSIQNTYAYKPYGGLLQKTGAGADPLFTWLGSRSYRQTQRSSADVYVRARWFATSSFRWTSRDPVWPDEPAYGYAAGNPILNPDPTGRGIRVAISCFDAMVVCNLAVLYRWFQAAEAAYAAFSACCAATSETLGGGCATACMAAKVLADAANAVAARLGFLVCNTGFLICEVNNAPVFDVSHNLDSAPGGVKVIGLPSGHKASNISR